MTTDRDALLGTTADTVVLLARLALSRSGPGAEDEKMLLDGLRVLLATLESSGNGIRGESGIEGGDVPAVGRDRDVEGRLISVVADVMDVDPVGVALADTWESLGADHRRLALLALEIGLRFGVAVPDPAPYAASPSSTVADALEWLREAIRE